MSVLFPRRLGNISIFDEFLIVDIDVGDYVNHRECFGGCCKKIAFEPMKTVLFQTLLACEDDFEFLAPIANAEAFRGLERLKTKSQFVRSERIRKTNQSDTHHGQDPLSFDTQRHLVEDFPLVVLTNLHVEKVLLVSERF